MITRKEMLCRTLGAAAAGAAAAIGARGTYPPGRRVDLRRAMRLFFLLRATFRRAMVPRHCRCSSITARVRRSRRSRLRSELKFVRHALWIAAAESSRRATRIASKLSSVASMCAYFCAFCIARMSTAARAALPRAWRCTVVAAASHRFWRSSRTDSAYWRAVFARHAFCSESAARSRRASAARFARSFRTQSPAASPPRGRARTRSPHRRARRASGASTPGTAPSGRAPSCRRRRAARAASARPRASRGRRGARGGRLARHIARLDGGAPRFDVALSVDRFGEEAGRRLGARARPPVGRPRARRRGGAGGGARERRGARRRGGGRRGRRR